MSTRTHVILGTGPLGTAVARSLIDRGETVRMVSRSGRGIVDGVETLAADLTDPAAAARAVAGTSVVYQCTQPAYHRWTIEFPALQQTIVDAAADAGADLVIADNLYSYGDPEGRTITESTPERPISRKGEVRRAMAQEALAAHRAGRLRVAITRPSNYFGPGYDQSGHAIFERAAHGKPVQLLGRGDQPRSVSFVPDAGAAMAAVGTSESGWGRVWITAIQPPLTQQEFADRVWQLAGQQGSARTAFITPGMMRFAGMFSPTIRAAIEMSYEFDRPFVASSAAFESTFDVAPTPLDDAIATTLRAFGGR